MNNNKNSTLGILSLIFSVIGCTFFVGIILAIIDLCKKDGKKKTLSIIGLVIGCAWFVIGATIGSTTEPSNESAGKQEAVITVEKDVDTESEDLQEVESTEPEETEKEPSEPVKEESVKEPEDEYIKVTSTELIDSFNANQVKCKNTYDKKKLEVTGSVESVGTDVLGLVYVCLGHETEYTIVGIQCYASDEATEAKIAELAKGDTITVRGKANCGSVVFSMHDIEILD